METISEFGKGSIFHKMTTYQESILVFGYALASRCCALNLFLMNIEMILGIWILWPVPYCVFALPNNG